MRILNIGNNKAIKLDNFIKPLKKYAINEQLLIKNARQRCFVTKANIKRINKLIKFSQKHHKTGLKEFVAWYKIYKNK